MDNSKKKEMINDYKNKDVIGAVYSIECNKEERRILKSTVDIGGIKNRFNFSCLTKSCPDPSLQKEFAKYGSEAFSLVVLEELKKKESQTQKEFANDIKALYELWLEKLK